MKAKMAKLCLLFILLCSLPVFYSCSDEADAFYLYEYWEVMFDPEPPISETSLSITGGTKLGIKGGVAPYTAEIADGQIATAYVDENNDIRISSIKLGSTSLMVKDADGRIIKIGLKVVNGKQSFSVNSVEARITGIDERMLDEVVIVGYGQQKKASVVGAIAQVSTKELTQSPVSNVSNALAGRLPGMITVQRSGEPGSDMANMYIRGISTFGSNQSPLILVDGVDRDIRMMDVSEIESISILKDASATAVYGVRGANGVVLVTTKRGKVGKATVTFSADAGIQSPTSMPEMVDSYNMAVLVNEALVNDGMSPKYTQEQINAFRYGTNEFLYPNVDWAEECLKKSALMQQYNVNITGGSEKVKYFVGANILMQGGLFKHGNYNENYSTNVKYTKYNFRSNLDFQLSSIFSAKLNLAGVIGDKHRPSPGGDVNTIFDRIKIANPDISPIRNPDGSWGVFETTSLNALAYLTDTGYADEKETAVQATVGMKADLSKLVKGLSVNVDFSFDFNNVYVKKYGKTSDMFLFNSDGSYTHKAFASALGFGDELSVYNSQYVFEPSINYNNTFGDHEVSGLVLFNAQEYVKKGDALTRLPYRRLGLVGRATYSYKNKYLGEISDIMVLRTLLLDIVLASSLLSLWVG